MPRQPKSILHEYAPREFVFKMSDRQSARWNLFRDTLSWSALSVWLKNREEFRLRYVEGWREVDEPVWIIWGEAFHHIMEQAYKHCKAPPSPKKIRSFLEGYVAKQKGTRKEPGERPYFRPEKYEEIFAVICAIAYTYFQYYEHDFECEWLALEEKFYHEYKFPDGKTVTLSGIIDGIPLPPRKRGGRKWVLDTKTKSRLNPVEVQEEFPLNFQTMLYMWVQYEQTGKMPAGAIINMVRRPEYRKTRKDKTLFDLTKRIQQKVAEHPESYFHRPRYAITKEELQHWKDTQLDPIMWDIRLWAEGKTPHYINPTGLYVGQFRTRFFDAMMNGDFLGLRKRPIRKKGKK